MRNTGWYIPYWRKPKKKGKAERAGSVEVTRSDEQLEAVRQRWVERYRRTLRAFRVLGLSMGSNRGEVQARYEALREAGTVAPRELEDAYRYLVRVLPPVERRKRRPRNDTAADGETRSEAAPAEGSAMAYDDAAVAGETDDGDELTGDADDDDSAAEMDADDGEATDNRDDAEEGLDGELRGDVIQGG